MPIRLTETAIAAALRKAREEGRKDLADSTLPGLRLRITAKGTATWVLACRDGHGRMRRFRLGGYETMGVAAARDAARAMREQVRQGADPTAERRRRRALARDAKEGIGTLQALIDHYGLRAAAGQKSWPEAKQRITSVFRAHLNRPLAALTRMDLQIAADGHSSQQSAGAAVRYLRPVIKWGVTRGFADADLALLAQPATVRRRDRVLATAELRAVLSHLSTSAKPYAAAMRFMLLTLARREEVCSARWSDIDLDRRIWVIRSTQAKNKQEHQVPLSRQAVDLLQAIGPRQPKDLVFATSEGGRLSNWDRETKAIQKTTETTGWTRHDLRRTGATLLGEMGELPDIVEAALNHVAIRSALAATYNRSRYRPQVAAALQRLADALDGIGAGSAVVVPMRREPA